jgi:hypothetical protein
MLSLSTTKIKGSIQHPLNFTLTTLTNSQTVRWQTSSLQRLRPESTML